MGSLEALLPWAFVVVVVRWSKGTLFSTQCTVELLALIACPCIVVYCTAVDAAHMLL